MTKGGTVPKSKYARLASVMSAEPASIRSRKSRLGKLRKKRRTPTLTSGSTERFDRGSEEDSAPGVRRIRRGGNLVERQLRRAGYGLGLGTGAGPGGTLARYREAVVSEERGAALETIVRDLRAAGCVVGGESYKKTPRGVPVDHPRASLLKHSGVFANLNGEHPKELGTPELVDFVFAHYARMAPLHHWLNALLP